MKNLCLDIGNVLCHLHFQPFMDAVSKRLNITYEEVIYFLHKFQKLHDLGLTSVANELGDHFKVKSPVIIKELDDLWLATLSPNWTIIRGVEETAKELGIKVALLSNIGFEHSDYFQKNIKMEAIKHFSCLVGARKPTTIYYQSFLMDYPEFKGALYIDDNKDNLATGDRMGFDTFYFNLEEKYDMIKLNANQSEDDIDILFLDRITTRIKESCNE
jgi:FMN phosphatase YigB (HAD superfamily)